VSWYQKGKTDLDFTEARDSEWQWHQLGQMQVGTSLQADNHASTPSLEFFTGRIPFLPPNQQHQSTEGRSAHSVPIKTRHTTFGHNFCKRKSIFQNSFTGRFIKKLYTFLTKMSTQFF